MNKYDRNESFPFDYEPNVIMNQMKFRWVYNQTENSHYDHIPFDLEIIRKMILRVFVSILKSFFLQICCFNGLVFISLDPFMIDICFCLYFLFRFQLHEEKFFFLITLI